jgi:hypothetical protein
MSIAVKPIVFEPIQPAVKVKGIGEGYFRINRYALEMIKVGVNNLKMKQFNRESYNPNDPIDVQYRKDILALHQAICDNYDIVTDPDL